MQKYIEMISSDFKYIEETITQDTIIFYVEHRIDNPIFPYCGVAFQKKHSLYPKIFMDIPLDNKNRNRKMFC